MLKRCCGTCTWCLWDWDADSWYCDCDMSEESQNLVNTDDESCEHYEEDRYDNEDWEENRWEEKNTI